MKKILFIILVAALITPVAAKNPVFRNYTPKVQGYGNRLTAQNILSLTAMPSSQGRALLTKVGYKPYEGNPYLLYTYDFYNPSQPLYMIKFPKEANATGFFIIHIFSQPEMRIIAHELMSLGYNEYRVRPRDGAIWTKVYQKSGSPTYSISLPLFPGMNPQAQSFNYEEYNYYLVCEKK